MTTRGIPDDELLALEAKLAAAVDIDVAPGAAQRIESRIQRHIDARPRRSMLRRLLTAGAIALPASAATLAAAFAGLVLTGALHRSTLPPSSAASSPSPSVASPAPSPTSTAGCRLAIVTQGMTPTDQRQQGGFLDPETGVFTPDPASLMTSDGHGAVYTTATPVLRGDDVVPSYDDVLRRWLPVQRRAISPDGMSYVYVDYGGMMTVSPGATPSQPIHLVDIATGTDRMLVASGQFDGPTWTPDGLFVVHHLAGTDHSSGLWRLDPTSGLLKQVDASGVDWYPVGHGGAWAAHPRSEQPGSQVRPGSGDTATRLDLATGTRTDWLYQPGRLLQAIGFMADGRPVIVAYSAASGSDTWVMDSPGNGGIALFENLGNPKPNFSLAVPDGQTTWFFSTGEIYRSAPHRNLERIPTSLSSIQYAGPCR